MFSILTMTVALTFTFGNFKLSPLFPIIVVSLLCAGLQDPLVDQPLADEAFLLK